MCPPAFGIAQLVPGETTGLCHGANAASRQYLPWRVTSPNSGRDDHGARPVGPLFIFCLRRDTHSLQASQVLPGAEALGFFIQ